MGLLREALDAAHRHPGAVEPAVLAQLHGRLASWGIWTLPHDVCRQLSDDALDGGGRLAVPRRSASAAALTTYQQMPAPLFAAALAAGR